MEIQYLYEFTVIAKSGSYSRAAEKLFLSQSSLSKHMQTLERELGVMLLIRNSRSVALSPIGEKILPLAEEAGTLYHQIRGTVEQQRTQGTGVLKVLSIPVMAQYNITGILYEFTRMHPELRVEILECEQNEMQEMLRRKEGELAFLRGAEVPCEGYETRDYFVDQMVAVVSEENPLSKEPQMTLSDLKEEPLMFLGHQTGLYSLCMKLFEKEHIQPNVVFTGHRPDNILDLAALNMGIGLLMERHVEYAGRPGVVSVPLDPPVKSKIALVYPEQKKQGPAVRQFLCFMDTLEDAGGKNDGQ